VGPRLLRGWWLRSAAPCLRARVGNGHAPFRRVIEVAAATAFSPRSPSRDVRATPQPRTGKGWHGHRRSDAPGHGWRRHASRRARRRRDRPDRRTAGRGVVPLDTGGLPRAGGVAGVLRADRAGWRRRDRHLWRRTRSPPRGCGCRGDRSRPPQPPRTTTQRQVRRARRHRSRSRSTLRPSEGARQERHRQRRSARRARSASAPRASSATSSSPPPTTCEDDSAA